MRSSILIVIGAMALGCGGRQDRAQTPPPEMASPSGAEGAAPPPMAGQEIQGQEQIPAPDMQAQDMQGQETQDQDMQGQTPGHDMQGMHDGHAQAGGEHDMAAACPMDIPGTTARTEDVKGGVAIVFATSTGDVVELQRRVAQMAEIHNQHHAQHPATPEPGQPGAQAGTQDQGMIAAQARAEDINRGARLVLTPQNPKQLKQVRQQIRQHAQEMASSGQCSMMEPGASTETPAQRRERQATGRPRP